jgi:hypothetical protein
MLNITNTTYKPSVGVGIRKNICKLECGWCTVTCLAVSGPHSGEIVGVSDPTFREIAVQGIYPIVIKEDGQN